MGSARPFHEACEYLLARRERYDDAYRGFRWPVLDRFNWALDWFDGYAVGNHRLALWLVHDDAPEVRRSFAGLAERSNRVANLLRRLGARRGDRLLLMLSNVAPLWETLLGAMKLGLVVVPTTTQLGRQDLADRIARGDIRHIVADPEGAERLGGLAGTSSRLLVGAGPAGWVGFDEAERESAGFSPDGETRASDPLLLYFTSGTTARPKLVEHTHASYPVGHLSTMYWIGLEPGDVHLNISSPGWAKHAWSNVFAPWNAEATVLVVNQARFDADALLDAMERCGVDAFCAPPTVWRMLIQRDLSRLSRPPREVVGAGEPLNPEVIEQVERAWGVRIRDGFGQTETTVAIANTPGQEVRPGSMGRPVPGYPILLVDPATGARDADEGEICIDLSAGRPLGLMVGYRDDAALNAEAMEGGLYHTGDIGARDGDGWITYVGRADDVFKASDYRISPFELESVLIEHPAVAEAAVVPSPDPVRLAVPKAYVALAPGHEPTEDTARAILDFAREQLAPYKRVRRLEFAELPKTISGKIRRVALRDREQEIHADPAAAPEGEFTT